MDKGEKMSTAQATRIPNKRALDILEDPKSSEKVDDQYTDTEDH